MRYAKYYGAIAGIAGALTLATLDTSVAAPVSTGATALKSATSSDVVDVRWRGGGGGGRGWGWGVGGFATGLAIGSLAARPYYYDPYYYAPPPAVYGPPPGPVYGYGQPMPDPNGARRQCWVTTDRDRGFGYYRPC